MQKEIKSEIISADMVKVHEKRIRASYKLLWSKAINDYKKEGFQKMEIENSIPNIPWISMINAIRSASTFMLGLSIPMSVTQTTKP